MVEETQEFAAELCTEYPPKAALQAPDSCGQLLTRILRPNVFFQVGGAVEGHDMAEPTLFGPLRQRGRLEAALRALVEAPALPWKPPLAGPPPLSPSKAWKAATHGLCGLCSDWDSLPLRTDAQAGSVDPMLRASESASNGALAQTSHVCLPPVLSHHKEAVELAEPFRFNWGAPAIDGLSSVKFRSSSSTEGGDIRTPILAPLAQRSRRFPLRSRRQRGGS